MPDAYDAWAERHAATFGLRSDEDARMLMAWTALFWRGGVLVEELEAATDWLALHDPPRFANEHLEAIREFVTRRREQGAARTLDRGVCTLCRGAGMVSVPSLKALAEGTWGTQAALCRCPLGSWVAARQRGAGPGGDPRPALQTLDEYERGYRDWRILAAEHDAESVRALRRKYGKGRMAEALDGVLETIACRMRDLKGA